MFIWISHFSLLIITAIGNKMKKQNPKTIEEINNGIIGWLIVDDIKADS